MLAYVFWHWKRSDVGSAEYLGRLRGFHRALAESPPDGFVRTYSFGVSSVPWQSVDVEAQEDWYLIEDFAALGELKRAAVSGSRKGPHDASAGLSAGGAGGLYELLSGRPLDGAQHAYWFSKPKGRTYAEVERQMASVFTVVEHALWQRQLVLGPTPEFCVQTWAPVTLPAQGATGVIPIQLDSA